MLCDLRSSQQGSRLYLEGEINNNVADRAAPPRCRLPATIMIGHVDTLLWIPPHPLSNKGSYIYESGVEGSETESEGNAGSHPLPHLHVLN